MSEVLCTGNRETRSDVPADRSGALLARTAGRHSRAARWVCTAIVLTGAFLVDSQDPATGHHKPGHIGGPPITITVVQNLEFGTLAGDGNSAGTATVNPVTGTKTVTGGVYDFGGISNAAMFNVTGNALSPYSITLPASITLTSGANTMTLNGFTSNPPLAGVFDVNGNATITVGATLQVAAGQAAGTYSGIFPITVDYQ